MSDNRGQLIARQLQGAALVLMLKTKLSSCQTMIALTSRHLRV